MTHQYRAYIQGAFAKIIGPGAVSKNCEISILNWTREKVSYGESSWENPAFRQLYKSKAIGILREMERSPPTLVPDLKIEDSKISFSIKTVPGLVRKLQTKQLDPRRIAWYSPDILWPDGPFAQVMADIKRRDLRIEEIKAQEKDYEGILQCRKCKSKKTEYYQLQTRSADEPMVRFLVYFFSISNSFFRQHTQRAKTADSSGNADN